MSSALSLGFTADVFVSDLYLRISGTVHHAGKYKNKKEREKQKVMDYNLFHSFIYYVYNDTIRYNNACMYIAELLLGYY